LCTEEKIFNLKKNNNEDPNIDDDLSNCFDKITLAYFERDSNEQCIKSHEKKIENFWSNNVFNQRPFVIRLRKLSKFSRMYLKKWNITLIKQNTLPVSYCNIIKIKRSILEKLLNDFKAYVFDNDFLKIEKTIDNEFEYSINNTQTYYLFQNFEIYSILNHSKHLRIIIGSFWLKAFDFNAGLCFAYFQSREDMLDHYWVIFDILTFGLLNIKIIKEKFFDTKFTESFSKFKITQNVISYYALTSRGETDLILMDFNFEIICKKGECNGVNSSNSNFFLLKSKEKLTTKLFTGLIF